MRTPCLVYNFFSHFNMQCHMSCRDIYFWDLLNKESVFVLCDANLAARIIIR